MSIKTHQQEIKTRPGLITIEEAAAFLLWSTAKIYTEAKAGRLPSYKIGRNRRFKIQDLESWVESRKITPAQAA
jgi:excisionase family DNA binding protein